MEHKEILPPLQGLGRALRSSDNQVELTTEYLKNTRPQDALEGRLRIGQRPGLDKWSTDQVGGAENPVVAICSVTSIA